MLRSDQPGGLRSSTCARARSGGGQTGSHGRARLGGGRGGDQSHRGCAATPGAGGGAAAAPTDDVTERPSREPSRDGRSRALPGRSLGRIMEAATAPAPDSVSAVLRPSSLFPRVPGFSPFSCSLHRVSLPPLPSPAAPGRGGPGRLSFLPPSLVSANVFVCSRGASWEPWTRLRPLCRLPTRGEAGSGLVELGGAEGSGGEAPDAAAG